jgi:hypothetical protein
MSAYWQAPTHGCSLSASTIDQRLRDLLKDEIALLGNRALLLQQRADSIVTNPASFTLVNARTGFHHCQAKEERTSRLGHDGVRVCNRLCYLSDAARSQLQYLDSQLQATLRRKMEADSMFLADSYREGMKVRSTKDHQLFENMFLALVHRGESDLSMYRGSALLRRGVKSMCKTSYPDCVYQVQSRLTRESFLPKKVRRIRFTVNNRRLSRGHVTQSKLIAVVEEKYEEAHRMIE